MVKKMREMYIVTSHFWEKTFYLAWQPPVFEDDGYFWTGREVVEEIRKESPEFNNCDHPFLFETEEAATQKAEQLKLKVPYTISKI